MKNTATARVKKPLENTTPEPAPETMPEVRPITPEEQAIAARVLGDSFDPLSLGEDSILDYSFGRDLFELPPPAKREQEEKRMSFRWIERKPARIDQVKSRPVPFKWWICNRVNTPFLKDFIDPVLGGVIREDCILMFKPWSHAEAEKNYKRSLADNQDQSGDLLSKDGEVLSDSGIKMVAGKRSIESGEMKHEIRGNDIIMAEDVDSGGGSEGFSDMVVED